MRTTKAFEYLSLFITQVIICRANLILRVVEPVKVVHLLGDAGVNILPSAIVTRFQQFELKLFQM